MSATVKALVAHANAHRLSTIKALESAVRDAVRHGINKTDFYSSELQTVAQRPTALGFSVGDLQFYAGHYRNRQEKACGFVQRMNLKCARNGGRWNGDDRKSRDDAAFAARIAGAVLKHLENELSRREGLRLQAERDKLARAAELQARKEAEAAKPAPVIEIPAPALPKFRKSKSTFRPAQKRTEFQKSVTSFADLGKLVKPSKVERARKAEVLGIIGQDALTELVKACKATGNDAETNGVIVRKQGATVNYYRRAA